MTCYCKLDFRPILVLSLSVASMSITIQIDLSESAAAEAKAKGLLEPQKLTQLVEREIKLDSPMREFREMVEQIAGVSR